MLQLIGIDREKTSSKIAQVQKEGNREITRNILLNNPGFKPAVRHKVGFPHQ